MNKMEKEFVSYDLSLKLKELGFNEPCFTYFLDGIIQPSLNPKDYTYFSEMSEINKNMLNYENVLSPLFSQAFRWFRDKYGLYTEMFVDDNKKFGYLISYFVTDGRVDKPIKRGFDSYEIAELECLKDLIQIRLDKLIIISKINDKSNVERYNKIIDEVYNEYTKKYVGYDDTHTKELFISEIKTNLEFSKLWGLKIKEKELTLIERRMMVTQEMFNQVYTGGGPETLADYECDQWNIPKKLITIKYKKEKVEVYI